ncbi:unnamed protein product, partial [Cyprideis torosa]
MEAMGSVKADIDRFNAIGAEMGDPDADMDALMNEMGDLQAKIDAANGWELERTIEMAMDALRCPPKDSGVTKLSGGWILEVDRGQGIPYEGNYSAYLETKASRMDMEDKKEAARQKTLARELEWIRQGAKARQAKSKARIAAYDQMMAESEKQEIRTAQIVIPTPPRLGELVIEAQNIRKGFEDRLLIEDLSFKLPPGGIVGIIGANGA